MEMIEHQVLKEAIPLFFILLFLFSKVFDMDLFYWGFFSALTLFIVISPLGGSKLNILNSWRLGISFFQYLAFCWLTVTISFYRTQKINLAFTLGVILTSASGYLYEIPRYLRLAGWIGLFRWNKYSPLVFDIQIYLLFLIPLFFRGIQIDLKTKLAGFNYLAYCWIYYHYFDSLIAFRRASFLWIWIPHIVMFRLPVMVLLLFLCNLEIP